MSNGIILFQSVTNLTKAEKLIAAEGCTTTRVPAPLNSRTGCTIGLRFPWSQEETIKSILEKGDAQFLEMRQL